MVDSFNPTELSSCDQQALPCGLNLLACFVKRAAVVDHDIGPAYFVGLRRLGIDAQPAAAWLRRRLCIRRAICCSRGLVTTQTTSHSVML